MTVSLLKPPPPFGTLPTIDGYDVIANDTGRPVLHVDTWEHAHAMANKLSGVLNVQGPTALAKFIAGMI